jgi:hypothetical protein
MAAHFPIAYAPMPFDFPLMRELMQIHRARAGDGGLTWLRAELKAAAHKDSRSPRMKASKLSIKTYQQN